MFLLPNLLFILCDPQNPLHIVSSYHRVVLDSRFRVSRRREIDGFTPADLSNLSFQRPHTRLKPINTHLVFPAESLTSRV